MASLFKWVKFFHPVDLLGQVRYLSSNEISNALRPFYFSVHPDLFGQYPTERSINENSLKQLSSYLETIQKNRPFKPTEIQFYLRPQGTITNGKKYKGKFKSVNIKLDRDVRRTVVTLLKTCDLPTTYIEKIPNQETSSRFSKSYHHEEEEEGPPEIIIIKRKVEKVRLKESLREWLLLNANEAMMRNDAFEPLRKDINKLKNDLLETFGIVRIDWDCSWNEQIFRGCLKSFNVLASQHPQIVQNLKGRELIFGNETGVNLEGHVMLSNSDVRHNWLDFLKNMDKEDIYLQRIPNYERAVSRVLRDIQVVRRKFQPKVMAKDYESQLRRLTTTLSDHQGRSGYPKSWPESLMGYQLVVETEAGPLMLSPTGQFIVPSSCPAFLLVTFITEQLEEAERRLLHYQNTKHIEQDLHHKCITALGLQTLHKDDNITPDIMITCMTRLIENKNELFLIAKGVKLKVTNFYSVLNDGEMCIPWNWVL